MVYVQYSTSSHNLQIYRIWYNSIFIMRELTMVDLLVYTNHRMGDMYCNTPFPHNVLSIVTVLIFFWGRFFFREVSVNDDIAVKLIVLYSRKCLREEIDSRDMFNIYLLDPYWSQKKRILYTPFFWHSIGWVEIFIYSFSLRSTNPTLIA